MIVDKCSELAHFLSTLVCEKGFYIQDKREIRDFIFIYYVLIHFVFVLMFLSITSLFVSSQLLSFLCTFYY